MVHAGSRKSTKKVCDENERRKNDGYLKYFLWKEGIYKASAEYSFHEYQMISGQRFLIH